MPGSWTISVAGRTYGPYSAHQMKAFAAEGRLGRQSLVAHMGETNFRKAADEPELSYIFSPPPPREGAVAQSLRRLPKGAQEAPAHPLPVSKSGFPRDFLDRQTSLLQHESGGFESKIFDGLRGRLSGLRFEHTAELPRTETCSPGKLFHG